MISPTSTYRLTGQIVFCLVPPILYFVRPYLAPEPKVGDFAIKELSTIYKYATSRIQQRLDIELNAERDRFLRLGRLLIFSIVFGVGDTCFQSLMVNLAGSMTTHVRKCSLKGYRAAC